MRTLKPEACTSETLAQVGREVRWTFACLWTHCDDDGRAVFNPRLIKAAIYPLDDDVTPDVIWAELKELESIGALCIYEVGGRAYLHVPAWAEHQHPNRSVPSRLPPCPKDEHSSPTHEQRSEYSVSEQGELTPVVVVGDVDVVGDVEGAQRPPRKRGTRLPDDWMPNDTLVAWTIEQGLNGQAASSELAKFRDYWAAKAGAGGTKLDWDATWRNWVRNALERHPKLRPLSGHSAFEVSPDVRAMQTLNRQHYEGPQ